jgi:hypothetical protein
MPNMRGQARGSSEVVSITNGSQPHLFCGSTGNVSSSYSLLVCTPSTRVFVAGSGKSIIWYVNSLLSLIKLTKGRQFCCNPRHHDPTRGRASVHGLFLLRLS